MSKVDRGHAAQANRRTNFTSDAGFESPPPRPDYGTVPHKGAADEKAISSMIDNLRREHFNLGQHGPTMHSAAKIIGAGVNSATPNGKNGLWAKKETNYHLGTDNDMKQTDYQGRFQGRGEAGSPAPATMAKAENLKNKAKITSTSVSIAATSFFDQSTTNKTMYNDVAASSRQQNTGLGPLTTSYITGSHWKTGYGGFAGQSE